MSYRLCTWCHLAKLDKVLMCCNTVLLSSTDEWCIVGQVGLGLIKPSQHSLPAKSMPALNLLQDCVCFGLIAFLLFFKW